jgi:nucleoside-diphosphate-sugar epimerase
MIMITGGLGFIGANLAKYFLERGEKIVITSHRKSTLPSFLQEEDNTRLKVQSCDILNLDSLVRIIQEHQVRSIVHGAAIYLSTEDYYHVFHVNVGGTMNVMEAAKRTGVKHVTVVSSRAVYAGWKLPDPVPENEEISIHASDYIQVTKKAVEILVLYYRRIFGMDVRVLRVARVYGPISESPRNPIPKMLESAIKNIPVHINHSPEENNDFVYVKDCVRGMGIVHLAPCPQHYIYNIGAGRMFTLSDFAYVIKNFIPDAQINFIGSLAQANELRLEACINIERISKEFSYAPAYDIEKGIIDYIRWIKDGIY